MMGAGTEWPWSKEALREDVEEKLRTAEQKGGPVALTHMEARAVVEFLSRDSPAPPDSSSTEPNPPPETP